MVYKQLWISVLGACVGRAEVIVNGRTAALSWLQNRGKIALLCSQRPNKKLPSGTTLLSLRKALPCGNLKL
ncbi:hypothetical protein [Syntrophomonas palmitatica]|uniref:hypothetical protein n=1 Tax=Syntrophomonas palmitatica TaxID=402877 RepID=UPI0006CFDA9B|nr:hypothetical protein [Syntrophomonas palmitatica]